MPKLNLSQKKIYILIISSILIISIPLLSEELSIKKNSPPRISETQKEIAVKAPPFSEGIFPCNECHSGMTVNYSRRVLTEEHKNITLKHDEKNRWCLDCHSAYNRNFLHLASGKLVSFDESFKLCGQCHGPTLRDWEKGVHGKRTGSWNGKKQYLLCVHCHDPHSPKFKPIKPLPPPVRQENIK